MDENNLPQSAADKDQFLTRIRNFSIIAHIDHGKTTLTNQLLKKTGTVSEKDLIDRILDSNPIERERGITIKLAPVTMSYLFNSDRYTLNLIDTPGHVDFSYEVSRSLSACEGAVLLIDATQGIQAQTLAHARLAISQKLKLIPVINKIDLSSALVDATLAQVNEIFGFNKNQITLLSAKTGEGVDELLERMVIDLPFPEGIRDSQLRALVFNSIYDPHLGVIAFIRVVDGAIRSGQTLYSLASQKQIETKNLGVFIPQRKSLAELATGEVGFIATGLKDIRALKVGDTITAFSAKKAFLKPLPGFKFPQPVVFADLYPSDNTYFNELKTAVEKLQLTDAALTTKQIHSPALGGGFRLGFLGLFHAEITQERLQREHNIETILTKPTVEYQVATTGGEIINVQHPTELPDPTEIKSVKEPIVEITVFTPGEFLGPVMQLFQDKRGIYLDTKYYGTQAQLLYHLPLAELISGLVDQLKSVSQGFASLDYKHIAPQAVEIVKLRILLNYEEIETFSRIVVKKIAEPVGREIVTKLKEILPRQMFALPIQAAIGGKIIARETKPAARKDVTAKLYGGDRTRRMKLLEKQKKGKKKMALLGKVNIPSQIFTQLLRI